MGQKGRGNILEEINIINGDIKGKEIVVNYRGATFVSLPLLTNHGIIIHLIVKTIVISNELHPLLQ